MFSDETENGSPEEKKTNVLTFPLKASVGNLLLTNLKRRKRLHGEELGRPQLEVEAETVKEGPDEHDLAGSQPEDGDAEGAQRCHQLLHHIFMFSTQVIIHVPAHNREASDV